MLLLFAALARGFGQSSDCRATHAALLAWPPACSAACTKGIQAPKRTRHSWAWGAVRSAPASVRDPGGKAVSPMGTAGKWTLEMDLAPSAPLQMSVLLASFAQGSSTVWTDWRWRAGGS